MTTAIASRTMMKGAVADGAFRGRAAGGRPVGVGPGGDGESRRLWEDSFRPIVESCLHDNDTVGVGGDDGGGGGCGNLWNGRLGVGVYLRIKLSELLDDDIDDGNDDCDGHPSSAESSSTSSSSKDYLRRALEILWSSLQREAAAADDDSSSSSVESSLSQSSTATMSMATAQPEPSRIGLLSNAFVGSRCLLATLLGRLGKREEAFEAAGVVLDEISRLYESHTAAAATANATASARQDGRYDCSVLFGLAGALQAIWYLRTELGDASLGRDLALILSYTILLEGLRMRKDPGDPRDENDDGNDDGNRLTLLWDWNRWPYLGAGTGSVGILYALLGHTDDEWVDLGECLPDAKSVVRKAIDDLAEHRYESSSSFSGRGNLRNAATVGAGFEEDDDEDDEASSPCDWTHGAPGYCLLLLKAFDVFGDERYFFHARDLAESVIWARHVQQQQQQQRRRRKQRRGGGVGLAKGASGIAYVFLAMGRVDRRDRNLWIERANKVAMVALSSGSIVVAAAGGKPSAGGGDGDDDDVVASSSAAAAHPRWSLFDGVGGFASLLIDLEDLLRKECFSSSSSSSSSSPPLPHFPFFESCQANRRPRRLRYDTRPEDHIFARRPTTTTTMTNTTAVHQTKQRKSKHPSEPAGGGGGFPDRSAAGTAPTEALTASVAVAPTPEKPTAVTSGSAALDVSQLTEPSATPQRLVRTTTTTTANAVAVVVAASTTPPTIFEITEAAAAELSNPLRPPAAVEANATEQPTPSPKRPQQQRPSAAAPVARARKAARAPAFRASSRKKQNARRRSRPAAAAPERETSLRGDRSDENRGGGGPFMTDSVNRKLRAEASWVRHFGTSRDRERLVSDRLRHLGSPPRIAKKASRPDDGFFRRRVGGFATTPDDTAGGG